MKVWESPFIPYHLTFKKFQIHSLSVNQSKLSICITFQNLEFWDVTLDDIELITGDGSNLVLTADRGDLGRHGFGRRVRISGIAVM